MKQLDHKFLFQIEVAFIHDRRSSVVRAKSLYDVKAYNIIEAINKVKLLLGKTNWEERNVEWDIVNVRLIR